MKNTQKQDYFIEQALKGENIFLTGKAGTGKSTIVKQLIEVLGKSKKVICCAPTGIAAININGQTIHSLFSMKTTGVMDFENCSYLKPIKRQVLEKADVIIVDEISMLRADILDGMHYTMKKSRLEGLHSKQIIFVGDLKQLPVVIDKNTEALLFAAGYNDFNFNGSKIYESLNVKNIELDEIVRQSDKEFIDALNEIREGRKNPYFRKFIGTEPKGIILAPRNATVQKYNVEGIKNHEGKLYIYKANYDGICTQNDFNLENELHLKSGCPVMYLVNGQNGSLLRNGTLGTFYMIDGELTIDVRGIKYPLEKHRVAKQEYVYDEKQDELVLKEVGSCEQYPIKLAYALSIHKSQGLTFDEVTVDLSQPAFINAQNYVAFSRVTSPDGLTILVK